MLLEGVRGGAGPGSTCEARPPFCKEVYAGLTKSQAGTRVKRGRRGTVERAATRRPAGLWLQLRAGKGVGSSTKSGQEQFRSVGPTDQ